MFGLDLLFDLDKNGKLDAFERAAEMEFLDIVDSGLQSGKSESSVAWVGDFTPPNNK